MVAEESLREEDASKRKMEGSVMIYEAGSLAEVREYIHNDPYWVENVVSLCLHSTSSRWVDD